MDQAEPLVQAFVFLAAAVISVPIAKRLGLGSVLGYLIAGAVIGPFGLKLLGQPHDMMHVAEFGVVIMLFLIGLELRPVLLWRMRGAIFGLGFAQVTLTGLALALALGMALDLPWQSALAAGLILSLSSTAIVLQTLRERGLDQTGPGRASFSVLLFQDLAVIPMLAFFPLLAPGSQAPQTSVLRTLAPGSPPWAEGVAVVAAIVLIVVAGRYLMRPIFRLIARTELREIFTATALALVVGVALLMEAVGLSAALGAFLAGVVLADSEYRHELEGDIEPFRGLLLGLFFISVGASIDFALLAREPVLLAALVAGLLIIKATVLFGLTRLVRHRSGDALIVAFGLAQGGEFAFVLFALVAQTGVLPGTLADLLIAVVALSMAVTPLLFLAATRWSERFMSRGPARDAPEAIAIDDPDVIVAGFGRFGQTVTRLLTSNGFRASVLDHDADQVETTRAFGYTSNFGDASRIDLLRAAGAERARLLVIAIDDGDKILEIAEEARKNFPHLKILARAIDRPHVYELMRRNVDAIERETFEGGIHLGIKALEFLGWRRHQAARAGRIFRRHDLRSIEELAVFWGEDTYRQHARNRTALLTNLMQHDLNVFSQGDLDSGWSKDASEDEARANEARGSS